jgi:hypothetical protein
VGGLARRDDRRRLAPDAPRRLLLGSDAYRLVRDALAARLAGVEAQQDQAAATDVDGWS